MRLLSCAHGGLQEVLDGDLVSQRLVEQPLAGRQLAVGQDLNLGRENGEGRWGSKVLRQMIYRSKQKFPTLLFLSLLSKTD